MNLMIFSLTHDNDIWKFNHLSTNWERIKIPYAPLTDFEIESDNSVFQRLENPMSYKIGNYIYVFGGDLGNFKLTNSLFRLNINNFKWTWLRGNTNLNQNNRYELDNNPGFVNVKMKNIILIFHIQGKMGYFGEINLII